MKIIDNVFKGMEFSMLGVGATFQRNGEYFIKIEDVYRSNQYHNAVRLADGELGYMNRSDTVYPFTSELIVL